MLLEDLVVYCREFLNLDDFEDYPRAFNGLQCANSGEVRRLGVAVDASLRTFELAAEQDVDCLLVHHGVFWGDTVPWTGVVYEKLRVLLGADMALYAVHLPLDFHPLLGNNVEMASLLGWSCEWVGEGDGRVALVRPNCSRELFRGL